VKKALLQLITNHRKLHPSLRVRDIYKILHQGTMGPRHLIQNAGHARSALLQEYDRLDEDERRDPLTEQVSMDGSVIRVNLRTFKQRSGDPESLFACVIDSAERMMPDESALHAAWQMFKALNRGQLLCFDHREITALDEHLSKHGFIAISHSSEYRKDEKPSYRVVLLRSLKTIWGQTL
jgi:hypothetical protein